MMSLPALPNTSSRPAPVLMVSLPAPPSTRSRPLPVVTVSLPAPLSTSMLTVTLGVALMMSSPSPVRTPSSWPGPRVISYFLPLIWTSRVPSARWSTVTLSFPGPVLSTTLSANWSPPITWSRVMDTSPTRNSSCENVVLPSAVVPVMAGGLVAGTVVPLICTGGSAAAARALVDESELGSVAIRMPRQGWMVNFGCFRAIAALLASGGLCYSIVGMSGLETGPPDEGITEHADRILASIKAPRNIRCIRKQYRTAARSSLRSVQDEISDCRRPTGGAGTHQQQFSPSIHIQHAA